MDADSDSGATSALAAETQAVIRSIYLLAGFYLFNFLTTLDLEYDLLTRKRKFKWPLVFYYGSRYGMLGFFITSIFASSIPVDLHVNCEALMIFITAFGEFARGFASINFALRTIAVWSHNRYIIVLMCLLVLGQWAMIIRNVCIEKAMWTPTYGCVTTSDNASWLTALFAYWVFFDTIVVFLNAYKHGLPTRSLGTQNSIKNILFNQGLSYYLVAFSADFIAIVCLATKVNMLTVSICTVAAETLSTIVACRAVRSLYNMSYGPSLIGSRPGPSHGRMSMGQVAGVKTIEIEMKTSTITETDTKAGDLNV